MPVSCVAITSTWGPAKPYLAGKTSIVFATQDNREYVLSVGFLKDVMEVHKMDRSGSVTSLSVQINDYPNSQWKLFLRTILSLAVGPPEVLGYDTSITMVPIRKGTPRTMTLQYYPLHTDLSDLSVLAKNFFTISSTIFIGDGLIGRGTCVFRVEDVEGNRFIIKDTWHDPKRCFTEGQILQLIQGIPYVPEYVQEVVVSSYLRSRTLFSRAVTADKYHGGVDRIISDLAAGRFDDRVHLRLQTKASKTKLKLITDFNNRKELAVALLCCVLGEVTIHSYAL